MRVSAAVVNSVSCPPSEWPIMPMPRAVHLRPRLQVVEGAPRVPDVFALQALALGDAVQGLEPLVARALELALRVLALAEAERVGGDGHVAAPRQLDRVVLVGRRAEAGRPVLADLELRRRAGDGRGRRDGGPCPWAGTRRRARARPPRRRRSPSRARRRRGRRARPARGRAAAARPASRRAAPAGARGPVWRRSTVTAAGLRRGAQRRDRARPRPAAPARSSHRGRRPPWPRPGSG